MNSKTSGQTSGDSPGGARDQAPGGNPAYRPRMIDRTLRQGLAAFPGIMITGPRAVGKSRTGLEFAASHLPLDDPEHLELCEIDPMGALSGDPPQLVDEWQLHPDVLRAVKRSIDQRPAPGRFIVTGSARNDLLTDTWPGTGRLIRFRLWGMSGRERFGPADALPLFDRWGDEERRFSIPANPPGPREYIEIALASGFHQALLLADEHQRLQWLSSYCDETAARDLHSLSAPSGRRKNRNLFRSYLESYALNTAGLAPHTTVYEPVGVDRRTANGYLDALATLGIVSELPPWSRNLRNRLITERYKRHFTDAGLAAAAVGLTVDDVFTNSGLRGRILDTFITAQLRAEAEAAGRVRMYHLRTANGDREIDLVAERGLKVYAFEFKAGPSPKRTDARHLIWFRDKAAEGRFAGGVVFHTGAYRYELDRGIEAVPIAGLWGPGLPQPDQPALPFG